MSSRYTGRFAPSPTGPLHLGSLLAAVASYLDARAHHGSWLLRIDDIDPPREQVGASESICTTLLDHGLNWDGEVQLQSAHRDNHDAAILRLLQTAKAFYCDCSRKQLRTHGGPYPGTCRSRQQSIDIDAAAVRVQFDADAVSFTDGVQGRIHFSRDELGGDFVICRRDGLIAYQLACAVDDTEHQITHVVRGSDLLDSTARQQYLQQLLGLRSPCYAHIPVIVNAEGIKLSKQSHAPPLAKEQARENLLLALSLLGQPLPPASESDHCEAILRWGSSHWNPEAIPCRRAIALNQTQTAR